MISVTALKIAVGLLSCDRCLPCRTALGRDYADVPPTHGVYRGKTESELSVAAHVEASDTAPSFDENMPVPEDWSIVVERAHEPLPLASPLLQIQQMQQQQARNGEEALVSRYRPS